MISFLKLHASAKHNDKSCERRTGRGDPAVIGITVRGDIHPHIERDGSIYGAPRVEPPYGG